MKVYTAYRTGRDRNVIKLSSRPMLDIAAAEDWADFMNDLEEEKPKARRQKHFVLVLPDDTVYTND